MPYLVVLALIISSSIAHGQSCLCKEYEEFISGQSKVDEDSFYDELIRSGDALCRAKALERLGMQAHPDSAEIFFNQALKIYDSKVCGETAKVHLYKQWAGSLYKKGDFSRSLEYSLKLLKASEELGDVYEVANTNTMISQLFNQMAQADKGIVFARKALKMADKIETDDKKKDLLFKVAKRYLWHYQDFGTKGSLDTSELVVVQVLAQSKKDGNPEWVSKSYSHMQGIAYERGNFALAIQYLDSSMQVTPPDDLTNLAINYYDLADLYLLNKRFAEAIQCADSSFKYYTLLNETAYIYEVFDLKSRIYKASGNFKEAFVNYEMYHQLRDSLNSVDKTKSINELEKKYNQEKNEQKIKELSQQRLIYLLFAITAVMIAGLIWILLRQKSLRQLQKIMETEQRLNRARMNPHFFFNTLAALQKYTLQQSDDLRVASSLAQFSKVMRKTLESTYNDWVSVEEEIEFLREYLNVQQVRFEKGISFQIEASAEIDTADVMLPSMLIQPLVENSLEHGFAGIEYKGNVEILFSQEGDELIIKVTDNGKGLNTGGVSTHKSRATGIIQDRIFLLNQKLNSKAQFDVSAVANGQGVQALIRLPLMHRNQV